CRSLSRRCAPKTSPPPLRRASSPRLLPEARMIRRRRPRREIAFSFDAFLDLVANVVGIVLRLILVAWVGARSYSACEAPPPPPAPPPLEEPEALPEPEDPLALELPQQRQELGRAEAALLLEQQRLEPLRQEQAKAQKQATELAAQRQTLQGERDRLG